MTLELIELPYASDVLETFSDEATVKSDIPSSKPLLHSILWQNVHPGECGPVQGILAEQIINDFNSYENFKKLFIAAAVTGEGFDRTLLVWSPFFKELEILQAGKHQDLTHWGVIPLMVGDVWEHASNLEYKNEREVWAEAWFNLVNWKDVLKRFEDDEKGFES